MDQYPLVSVIIPTFNRCEFLKETLSSIFEQTYVNFEIIIISDFSSDGTLEMIKDLNDDRCYLYQLDIKSNGPAFVRNYGISKSKGSLIAFCDDDDLWMPQKLEKQINIMLQEPEIAIVATNVTYFGALRKPFLFLANLKSLLNRLNFFPIKYLLAFYNCLVISSSMVRKSALGKNRFNELDEFQGHEDLDLWLRICIDKKAYIISQPLIKYRVHPNQLSSSLNESYKKQSLKILRERLVDFNLLQTFIYRFRLLIYKVFRY